jgi:hypothetical protein
LSLVAVAGVGLLRTGPPVALVPEALYTSRLALSPLEL